MLRGPKYSMADFPELRALDRDVAAQILSEAIEAMKLKGEQSAYRSVVEGHGVLRIFCPVLIALQPDPGVDLFAASAYRPSVTTLAPYTACPNLTPPGSPSRSCAG
jgi:hypothetical protein